MNNSGADAGQTSNKTGKHSTMQKPSSSRPTKHDITDEPVTVDGAGQNPDKHDGDKEHNYISDWVPPDKASKR